MGYTLLAFAVAASAGHVLRSTLSAVVVAVVVQAAVMVTVILGDLRMHYLPAETSLARLDPTDVAISMSVPGAATVRFEILDSRGNPLPDEYLIRCSDRADKTLARCLADEDGVEVRTTYQPLTRFWSFQAIESGLVAALAVGVLALGRAGLRRRLH